MITYLHNLTDTTVFVQLLQVIESHVTGGNARLSHSGGTRNSGFEGSCLTAGISNPRAYGLCSLWVP